jgi:hypothetical protein
MNEHPDGYHLHIRPFLSGRSRVAFLDNNPAILGETRRLAATHEDALGVDEIMPTRALSDPYIPFARKAVDGCRLTTVRR